MMSKLILVPNEIAAKFNTKPLKALDKDMSNIIHSTDADDVKWKKYSQVLQKYLHLKNAMNTPIELNITHNSTSLRGEDKLTSDSDSTMLGEEQSTEEENEEDENVNLRLLKAALTKKQFLKANEVFSKVLDDEIISVDKRGQILINNKVIIGSHINEILTYLVKTTATVGTQPTGWNAFKFALQRSGFPTKRFGVSLDKRRTPTKKSPYQTRNRKLMTTAGFTPQRKQSAGEHSRRGESAESPESDESPIPTQSVRSHRSRSDTPRPSTPRRPVYVSSKKQWREVKLS